MGWKASFALCSSGKPGYLGSAPAHDPELARELIKKLDLSFDDCLGVRSFAEAINPPRDCFCLGAYPGAVFYSDSDLKIEFSAKPAVLRLFANYSESMIIKLYSTVNLFGFAYYREGVLVRAFGGDIDHDDPTIDIGEPLPEEQGIDRDNYDSSDGEELVFAVTGRFFGVHMDIRAMGMTDHYHLKMEAFRKA